MTDSLEEKPHAWERVHCFDEKTGAALWTYSYEADYVHAYGFQPRNKTGPYSTPIVEAGKLYALGLSGDLVCLDAVTGELLWKMNFAERYGLGDYSTTPSPLIEGDLLILVPGCQPKACVMALDKNTGKEVWKSLEDRWTYSSPIVISAGGRRQLIVWTREAITSLDPATGQPHWREPVTTDYAVVTPVCERDRLLVNGIMFQLDPDKPAATVLWPRQRTASKVVLSQTSPPFLRDDCVYSHRLNGHLVCLDAATGDELWRSDKVTGQKNAASIDITANGDSVLIFTDQGNLIRAHLTRDGYEELSRVHLIDATQAMYGRDIVWTPPAYANRHVFARNDQELVCASLEATP